MKNIEEVKKILEIVWDNAIGRMRLPAKTSVEAFNLEDYAHQICQLFSMDDKDKKAISMGGFNLCPCVKSEYCAIHSPADKDLFEQAVQIVLEIRQELCNTEFAPEPFTTPLDLHKPKVEFPNQILALLSQPVDKDLREVAKYLFTMMYPLSEWSKANKALRASFLSSAGKVLALIKPVKLRRLRDEEIGNAVLSVAVKDQWFFDGEFLRDNLPSYQVVAQAQLDQDNKGITFEEE